MQLKPKPKRTVRIIARCDTTGGSKSLTVYDTTPEAAIKRIRKLLSAPSSGVGNPPASAGESNHTTQKPEVQKNIR